MMDAVSGFLAPLLIYALLLALHLALPSRRVAGYVLDSASGEALAYRLNGLLVLLASVLLWALVGLSGLLPWDWLYLHRWPSLAGSCVIGLVFSLAMVARGKAGGRPFLVDFYLGRLENPRLCRGRVDAKMFLYLVGATMLALNLLSFLAHHLLSFGSASSPGVLLYSCLFLWFVVDYLVFERVHLYTYDIFAERVGFKLGWGCLTFYPYFYAVGLWFAAGLPDPRSPFWFLVLCALLFFVGWTLSRGANMQKYSFKTSPGRRFLGLEPRSIGEGQRALLCGGFWGISRHVNYLGEILMALALALTLSLGRPGLWAAWLYPLYYLALLLPRERADERRCAAKYGELWAEYLRRVPWRIIPGIY
jgi:protein-S-isoprenylcysteine O-methyltransferase Ste14